MIVNANALHIPLADESVHCCITSPPYWGLRDYGIAGQLGLEATPELYVANMVAVFREVWRVLRDDGTLFINIGDSYYSTNTGVSAGSSPKSTLTGGGGKYRRGSKSEAMFNASNAKWPTAYDTSDKALATTSIKPKDLVGIPWMLAFALRADGWYLRSEIIWHKPNPMPESVTDRPTKAHEQIFLLTKQPRYYYDAEAIRENFADDRMGNSNTKSLRYSEESGRNGDSGLGQPLPYAGRNRRTVWTVATNPFSGAHFATFPPALVQPMVLAGTSAKGVCSECGAPYERIVEKSTGTPDSWNGSKFDDGKNMVVHPTTQRREDAKTESAFPEGTTAKRLAMLRQQARENGGEYVNQTHTVGWQPTCTHDAPTVPAIVLDPFCGSGTTGEVAKSLGRRFIGLDLSIDYLKNLALPRAEGKNTQEAVNALPLFQLCGGSDGNK